MAAALQHYRLSMLGQDLAETLEELIANKMFDKEHKELAFQHFDRAFLDALTSQVKNKAVIKGAIDHYRNHDDIWTIFLKRIELKLDNKCVASNAKTEMIFVSKR